VVTKEMIIIKIILFNKSLVINI